jgi:hypothetical protein
MFTQRVVMSPANEIETVEPTSQSNLRRESGLTPVSDARGSRILLRIPDCTARLSTVSGEGVSWWTKLHSISQLAGPWLDVVRPIAPPRVLAAAAIGILLGFVMILLTPSEKPIPTFRTHREQAATGQRPLAPPPADEGAAGRPNVGTTPTKSAAEIALRPNAPASVDGPQPQFEIRSPGGAPAARLIPTIEETH